MSAPKFKVVRSNQDGFVQIGAVMQSVWDRGVSIKAQMSVQITTAEARVLAETILLFADEADAKVAKKQAADARRAKWREREIAAGRIRMMTPREFFR